jgi:hypothetical protein
MFGKRMLVPSVALPEAPLSKEVEYRMRCPGWSSSVGLFFQYAKKALMGGPSPPSSPSQSIIGAMLYVPSSAVARKSMWRVTFLAGS